MSRLEKLFASGEAELLAENAVLIDVRSTAEFAAEHIKDAIPLPLDYLAREIDRVVVDQATPIIVYSQSGVRSASAHHILINMGYMNIANGGAMRALASQLNREMARLELSAISSSCNAENMVHR